MTKKDRTRLLQFFRRAVRHVVKQGKPAVVRKQHGNACLYYVVKEEQVLRCAIGGAVKNDVAKVLEERFAFEAVGQAENKKREVDRFVCKAIGVSCSHKNLAFLRKLQGAHDHANGKTTFVPNFLRRIAKLAKEYDIPFDREEYA